MIYDVVVIGGGPVGCFTAAEIAKNGLKVLVVEEHKKIGNPVQCAGLVSPRTMALASAPKDLVMNEYSSARILSPLGGELLIEGDRVHAQAINRAAFDRHMASQALETGAEIITSARATKIYALPEGFTVTVSAAGKTHFVDCRLLIGADGVNSRVSRWLGLQQVNQKVYMYAGDFELSDPNPGEVTVLLGQSYSPGWFGWIIPLDGRTARVGVGSIYNDKSSRHYLKSMIRHFPSRFKNFKELRYTGGSVPFSIMKKIYSSHAMLVGDAAAQTKPMSGGGIYTGLRSAQICSRVAVRALMEDRLHDASLYEYQSLWNKEFRSEFRSGLKHREVYNSMSDREIESLLSFLDRPYWRSLIAGHGDIDYPSWLARRLFSAGPWVQKFALAAVELTGYRERLRRDTKDLKATP